MRVRKRSLSGFFLFLTINLCFSQAAFAQLTVLSYSPAATETSPGSHYYSINNPMPYDNVTLLWNFSKGLDAKFVQDISNITVREKGSSTDIAFDTSAGTITSPAPGYEYDVSSLLIQNADFTYLKAGSGTDPIQFRLLTLRPTTVAFAPDTTYVVTIDNSTTLDNGTTRTFQANNNNILDFTYAFEFITGPLPSSTTTSIADSSTTTTIADNSTTTTVAETSTTTTIADTSTTTSVATSTTTTEPTTTSTAPSTTTSAESSTTSSSVSTTTTIGNTTTTTTTTTSACTVKLIPGKISKFFSKIKPFTWIAIRGGENAAFTSNTVINWGTAGIQTKFQAVLGKKTIIALVHIDTQLLEAGATYDVAVGGCTGTLDVK